MHAKQLSIYRLAIAFLLILEIFSFFLVTLGLSQNAPVFYFAAGMILKIGSGLTSSVLQNKAGSLWSLEMNSYLKTIKIYSQEISTHLANKGCAEAEIQALPTLPTELYQSELNSYQRQRLLMIGAPCACGAALLFQGEIVFALLIVALGLSALPIGEFFFNKHTLQNDSKLRLARSAQLLEFIREAYNEHIFLTLQINFLSQIPLVLFLFRFLWNTENVLPLFFGLTQGLAGLTGTLAFQRSRATSLRSTQTAEHLIDALSSKDFIITPIRWREHVLETKHPVFVQVDGLEQGVIFKDFRPCIFSRSNFSFSPLTCHIPSGKSCIIQAPSGYGKSTLMMSLMHMVEHQGDLYFVNNRKVENAHELSPSTLREKIFFLREENVDQSFRLTDFFRNPLKVDLNSSYQDMVHQCGAPLTELAWEASDNLIEKEIDTLRRNLRSVFPKEMLDQLEQMRQLKTEMVSKYLIKFGTGLSKLSPERSFFSLSSGEKKRVICAFAFERARAFQKLQLIVLDEPLSHLDNKSLSDQLVTIQRIQELPNPPSLLIVTHTHIRELQEHIKPIPLVNLTQI